MGHYQRALIGVIGWLALGLLHAGTDHNPDEVLERVKAKILASAERARDFMCVETVERKFYRATTPNRGNVCPETPAEWRDPARGLRLVSTDRLRLDVTLTENGESYSWVGASRFDGDIDAVVRRGPIGSGAFASFLDVIFRRDVNEFHFEGHRLETGDDLMEYSFAVARSSSHYQVKESRSWAPAAYAGSAFVDPTKDEVIRLRIATTDRQAASSMCRTETTVDYDRSQESPPFLLPGHTEQRFVIPGGVEVENATNFTNCREYRGESTIEYEPVSASRAVIGVQKPVAEGTKIQPGMPFTLELIEAIDTDSAAAGDRFRAKLVGPLRDSKGRKLADTGSVVEGRLRRVQMIDWPPEVMVVLAPGAILIGDQRVSFSASRDWTNILKEPPGKREPIFMPQAGEGPAGVFRFLGRDVVVPAGLRTEWRTAAKGAVNGY